NIGGGKRCIIHQYINYANINVQLIEFSCTSITVPKDLINVLDHYCICINTASGYVMRAKMGIKIILYIRNISLLKHDAWSSNEFIEFIIQITSLGGYYHKNVSLEIEFIRIDFSLISIILSYSFEYTNMIGHYNFSDRLVNKCIPLHVIPPNENELNWFISSLLKYQLGVIFEKRVNVNLNGPKVSSFVSNLSQTICNIYQNLKTEFCNKIDKSKLINLYDLKKICCNIVKYNISENFDKDNILPRIVVNEFCYVFGNRIVNKKLKELFYSTLSSNISNDWNLDINDQINVLQGFARFTRVRVILQKF
ncbi:hypothetical protein A3Q56_08554, partial [Intoshia linei]